MLWHLARILSRHFHAHFENAQSVRNKTTAIADFLLEKNVDILFLTETWPNQNDHVIIGEFALPGYSFLNIPRLTTNLHGGIGVIFKTNLH